MDLNHKHHKSDLHCGLNQVFLWYIELLEDKQALSVIFSQRIYASCYFLVLYRFYYCLDSLFRVFPFKPLFAAEKTTLTQQRLTNLFILSPLALESRCGKRGFHFFFLRKYLERELQSFIPDFMQIFEELKKERSKKKR